MRARVSVYVFVCLVCAAPRRGGNGKVVLRFVQIFVQATSIGPQHQGYGFFPRRSLKAGFKLTTQCVVNLQPNH